MANQWFYTSGDDQKGPVSSEELKQLAASGQLSPEDLIWKEGLDDWKPASQLKGLFPAGTAAVSAPVDNAGATVAVSSPVVDVGDAEAVGYATSRFRGRGERSGLWQVPHLVAAVLLCTAMFLPWWSLKLEGEPDEIEKAFAKKNSEQSSRKVDTTKIKKIYNKISWYSRNLQALSLDIRSVPDVDDAKKLDLHGKVWGWHTGLGMMCGFLGFALLPLTVALLISPSLRRYGWITSLLAAYAGFLLFLFTLLWYLESPGYDVSPVLSQGAHAGPYLAMSGTLLLLIFGLIDGLSGFAAFRRSR